jgi:hypothetical protein
MLIVYDHDCGADLLFRAKYLLHLCRILVLNKNVPERLNKTADDAKCGGLNVMPYTSALSFS